MLKSINSRPSVSHTRASLPLPTHSAPTPFHPTTSTLRTEPAYIYTDMYGPHVYLLMTRDSSAGRSNSPFEPAGKTACERLAALDPPLGQLAATCLPAATALALSSPFVVNPARIRWPQLQLALLATTARCCKALPTIMTPRDAILWVLDFVISSYGSFDGL